MNAPAMFRIHRRAQGESGRRPKKLRPLRKGVADIALRAQVSQELNNRFMDGLATFSDQSRMRDLLSDPTRASTKNGRRVRALDPIGKDRQLLEAISDAAFTVCGITNAALRQPLSRTAWGFGRTDKQLSARISRSSASKNYSAMSTVLMTF